MSEDITKIIDLVKDFYLSHQTEIPCDKAPVSGKVYDQAELVNLLKAALEGWWTDGPWVERFEKKLKDFLGASFCLTVNSGSSANLLALKALTARSLSERRINPGDEVITTAAAFPTTVNPIIEVGAIPVFVDIEIGSYNAKVEEIEKAIAPKTKAIFLAHTLGNPFDIEKVKELSVKNNLWLIEDNCDSLGSEYKGKRTGVFGDLSTLSFYPAHHITTAEGGAVITNNPRLYKTIRAMRDWGRDCWCPTGKNNTCQKRFSQQFGDLPFGYDHKYIYSEIGYNLKMTDLQAAIGEAQMDKLPGFIKKRRENFQYLYEKLKDFEDYFILPQTTENSAPAWFGFLLTIRDSKIDRTGFLKYLNEKGIDTRLLFGGNITRQPYFVDYKIPYRQIGNLENTDKIMQDTFWLGVYPALERRHLDYVYQTFKGYINYSNFKVKEKVPKISIVMSTYNRKKDLLECLNSIKDNEYPNLQIVLVDNGCIDGSKEAVNFLFPEVKVVRTEKNLGAVGGINLGIKNVPEDSSYVLFLDDDYILERNVIFELLWAIHNKQRYGASTAKVLYFENPKIVQVAYSAVGAYTGINYIESGLDDGRFDEFKDTEGIGGTGLVKIEVLKKVGLRDETFFYYYDDPDFSMRIIEAGYKILYVPTSRIFHKLPLFNKQQGKQRWFSRAYWVARNKIIFMRKYSKCFPIFVLIYPGWFLLYTYQALRYGSLKGLIGFYKGMLAGFKWAFFDYRSGKSQDEAVGRAA